MEDRFYLVDVDSCGNNVRLHFGTDVQYKKSWGDGWDDIPAEHNAGSVYDEYVDHVVTYDVDTRYVVADPMSGYFWTNSPYSRQDYKCREVPALVVCREEAFSANYMSMAVDIEMSKDRGFVICLGDDEEKVRSRFDAICKWEFSTI